MKIKTILNIGVASTFVIVVTAVLMIAARGYVGQTSSRLPVLGTVTDFSLAEAGGGKLTLSDLRGKVWVASFIFTRCAEACPMMMRKEVKLQMQLPVRDDLRLVSFSVDPDWDTPKVLTEYAAMFGTDRSRWLFLTGDRQQIYRLARESFRLSTEDTDPAKEMPILHSSKLVLVDRNGAIRGYYDTLDDADLRKLLRDVDRVLAEKS